LYIDDWVAENGTESSSKNKKANNIKDTNKEVCPNKIIRRCKPK